jgi:DNA-binding response OmpR family regulator
MGLVSHISPLTVLVVDDLRDGADSTACLLGLYGFETRVAYSATEALALAIAEPPDVAVLDIAMPRMDGWQLARKLRECSADRRPLLVALTGCGTEGDRQQSAEAGIDLHLVKPIHPAVLVGVLKRFERTLGRVR